VLIYVFNILLVKKSGPKKKQNQRHVKKYLDEKKQNQRLYTFNYLQCKKYRFSWRYYMN